ncbi:hypothetical protein [Bythopirellula polymerisocia]|uniref:Uncharacterized protein n=1 Tax=Bythopirellula polymerisocia TaxID=2528003 RepID=A0A5C6CUK2_9BACT|nr:hypothetical protein [Bythopirellula polymerisocia]TWU28202.1 hypothetical protein Pla144_14890 [Bythopirellula polymerisocia]
MAKLATCPGCTTQLALPEEATLSDEARCPRCGEEFPLMEAVQFSIPTAELIPANERNTSSEVVEWAAKPLEGKQTDFCAAVDEPVESDEEEPYQFQPKMPESIDPDLNATLSDWEARLKRAISDTAPSEMVEDSTGDDPQLSCETEFKLENKSIDELKDFSFPHEDLEPQVEPELEPSTGPLSAAETEEFEFVSAESTISTSADATTANLVQPTSPEMVINTTQTSSPRKKKNRSLSRTMLSASLGVVGIPLGLYALLWIKGPAADMAHLANYLPQFILPPSMQSPTSSLEENAETLALNRSEPLPSKDEQATPPLVADPEVQPATAEVPAYNGPRFEMVDGEEFSQLLSVASQAAPDLIAGDLAAQSDKSRMGHAYISLCRLADKCSFMNQPGHSAEDADHVAEAQELLETTFSSPDVLADLPQIAGPWWEFVSRPSPGIVLTGSVERVEKTAAGSLAHVKLGEMGASISVLLGGDSPHLGTQLGVVGSIVSDPSSKIPALSGLSEPIVVAHFSFPIAGPNLGDMLSVRPH